VLHNFHSTAAAVGIRVLGQKSGKAHKLRVDVAYTPRVAAAETTAYREHNWGKEKCEEKKKCQPTKKTLGKWPWSVVVVVVVVIVVSAACGFHFLGCHDTNAHSTGQPLAFSLTSALSVSLSLSLSLSRSVCFSLRVP